MANTHTLSLVRAAQQYTDNINSLYYNVVGSLSLEAWVTHSGAFGGNFTIMSVDNNFDGGTNNRTWWFYLEDQTRKLVFVQSSDGRNTNSIVKSTSSVPTTCTHVAVTFNTATREICFYINGSLDLSTTGSVTTMYLSSTTGFKVGARANDPKQDFHDGTIDDVRFWNVVRSASEISANYQRELAGNESGLVGYWKLNNNYSDSSPNGTPLNPVNVPNFSTAVCFVDNTTTSTSTTSTSSSTSTTTTSTSSSTTTTSTSSSTSTSRTTSTSTTSTSTTSTQTTTSTTTTSTSTTSSSTSTTTTSTSTSSSTSTSTSTTITIDLKLIVEKAK